MITVRFDYVCQMLRYSRTPQMEDLAFSPSDWICEALV